MVHRMVREIRLCGGILPGYGKASLGALFFHHSVGGFDAAESYMMEGVRGFRCDEPGIRTRAPNVGRPSPAEAVACA